MGNSLKNMCKRSIITEGKTSQSITPKFQYNLLQKLNKPNSNGNFYKSKTNRKF